MSKGLEALESIIETFYDKDSEDIQIVRKELKALEIIRNKNVNIVWLNMCFQEFYGYESYNRNAEIKITREEYELLKEVLI